MAEESADNPFSQPTPTSDVVLVVEGRNLHVSKAILAVMSPVFEKMFYGKSKKIHSRIVTLPGKKHDEMVEFLHHIYPTTLEERLLTKKTVEAVMMLADEYQVQSIFDKCVTFLTSANSLFTASAMVHFLHISEDKVQLKKVYDHFIDAVAMNYRFRQKTEEDEFDDLSLETRYKVVRKRVYYLEIDRRFNAKYEPPKKTAPSWPNVSRDRYRPYTSTSTFRNIVFGQRSFHF